MTERPTTHQEKLEAMQGILDGWDRAVEERRDKRAAQNPPQNQSMPDLQPGQCVITKDNIPQGLPVPEQHIDKALINLRETQKKLEQTLPPSMRGQVQTPTYGKYCNQSNTHCR